MLHIDEKSCLFVGVGTQKSQWQEEKCILLNANCDKILPLLESPPRKMK
jgi:hypothetical protein